MIKPCLNVFKRTGGSFGYSGHCISFAQEVSEFATVLPWPVDDLPIILLKSSKHKNERQFEASASRIRNALIWLKNNHPDYKDIEISEDNLSQYPEGGHLQGIKTINDGDIELELKEEDLNSKEDEFLNEAFDEFEFNSKDFPRVNGIVPEIAERELIEENIKKALKENLKDKNEKSTVEFPVTSGEKKFILTFPI